MYPVLVHKTGTQTPRLRSLEITFMQMKFILSVFWEQLFAVVESIEIIYLEVSMYQTFHSVSHTNKKFC